MAIEVVLQIVLGTGSHCHIRSRKVAGDPLSARHLFDLLRQMVHHSAAFGKTQILNQQLLGFFLPNRCQDFFFYHLRQLKRKLGNMHILTKAESVTQRECTPRDERAALLDAPVLPRQDL